MSFYKIKSNQRRNMNTRVLTDGIKETKEFQDLIKRFSELCGEEKKLPLLVEGVSDGALYALTYCLITEIKKKTGKPILILTGEERRANKLNEFFKNMNLVNV